MSRDIRYCPDRHCSKNPDGEFDIHIPLCLNDDVWTTYCSTVIEFDGCPRGFEL